jgi:dephospho-CoA kinase
MKLVALTGSIGMGKSTALAMFKMLGARVWDADAAVHRIYAQGGAAIEPLRVIFPNCITPQGSVNRDALSKIVLNKTQKLKQLEAVVHPLVGLDRASFLKAAQASGAQIAILDIPLLFETNGQAHVDAVVVVTCEAQCQRVRVLARPGMTVEKFEAILARQTPDAIKRAKADFIITTDISLDETRKQVETIYAALLSRGTQESEPT